MAGLLTVFVHPDDETMTSGLLYALKERKIDISFAVLTRGEGGRVGNPPLANKFNLGLIREDEMKKTADLFAAKNLYFFNVEDPAPEVTAEGERLYGLPDIGYEEFKEKLIYILSVTQPEAIITHGSNGEYGHPGHIFTGSFCRKALKELNLTNVAVYTILAKDIKNTINKRMQNEDDEPNFFIDTDVDKTTEHLLIHRTQHLTWAGDSVNTDTDFRQKIRQRAIAHPREGYKYWKDMSKKHDVISEWLKEIVYI